MALICIIAYLTKEPILPCLLLFIECLDGGFTCPNRDGTLDTRGCIFCSAKGSGDFTAKGNTIVEQIENGKKLQKWQGQSPCYIAYFQAFTNTYWFLS